MPKPKTFTETRIPFTIRLPESLHEQLKLARPEAAANLNEYVNRLISNDMDIVKFEELEAEIKNLKIKAKGLVGNN